MMATTHDLGERIRNVTGDPPPDDNERTLPPPPVWPAGTLPGDLERYVDAQARSIGVPPEMVAVPLLVFAGGVIGNMVRLQIKPAWNVFPTVWAGVIGDPASKKSPTLQAAQWPVNRLQDALHAQWQADKDAYEAERAENGGKGLGFPPKLEHVFTTDTTMEALTRILAENRGVSIVRDELSGFIGGLNKYRAGGRGDDRQNYLSLWAGTTIKVDRVAGGTSYAAHPVGCVYGGIQPDLAGALHTGDGSRDGMVERFLLFWPEVVRSGWTDDEVNPDLVDTVGQVYAELRRFMPPVDADRITVKMSPDARRRFIAWYNDNDAAIGDVGGLRRGFYGKLDSQLARLALVLHCLNNPDDPRPMLDEATMAAAISIAEFFRDHLDRVLPLLTAGDRDAMPSVDARILRILRNSESTNADGWVRHSVIYNRLRNVDRDTLADALARHESAGTVESRIDPESTTKPARQWRVTPFVLSDYSEYSPSPDPNRSEKVRIIRKSEPHHEPNGHRPGPSGNDLLDEMSDWSAP